MEQAMTDTGMAPDCDPVAAAARRDADLDAIVADLSRPSAHDQAMSLPGTLCNDGGM
jgi:hypothetical protein